MPALRGPDGKIVFVGDDEVPRYTAGGEYTPVSDVTAGAAQSVVKPEDRGAIGTARAGLSAFLSGLTLSGSDWVLKSALSQGEGEQLAAEREANPLISGTAQAAGAILPGLISGGAATPAGALSRLAGQGIEAGAAAGGLRGAAQQLAAAGAEGALQNAGVYLSDTALGDRELSAEGITGALGTGFAFGAGGLAAAHGIEAGTIAARRLFARYAEGGEKAAELAAQDWATKSQAALEGFDQAADAARAKLAEARGAREQAGLARQRAAADLADARAGAAGPVPEAELTSLPPVPPDAEIAGLLRDRALAAATPQHLATWDAQNGAKLEAALKARGPRSFTSGAIPEVAADGGIPEGLRALVEGGGPSQAQILNQASEAEIAAALHEYDAARAAFGELHASVDPELESLLGHLQAPEVGAPGALGQSAQFGAVPPAAPSAGYDVGLEDALGRLTPPEVTRTHGGVPVGEFGAPGARGIKSPAELEAALREAGSEPLAHGTPAQAQVTRGGDLAGTRVIRKNASETPRSGASGEAPAIAGREIAGEQEFRQLQDDLRSKLTPDEIKQSIRFSREYYIDVNRHLRGVEKYASLPESESAIIPALDSVLSKSRTSEPIVTHRAVHFDPDEAGYKLQAGDVFVDPGYLSTSYRSDNINRFGNVHFVITSPAGTSIAAIPSSAAEGELLLPRGSRLRILSREESGGRITLKAVVEGATGSTSGKSLGEIAAGQAPVRAAEPPAAGGARIAVERVGRPSAGTFEARAADGAITPLNKGEVRSWLESQLPDGFSRGKLETHRNFTIEHGVPRDAAGVAENAIYVVKPSELADRGVLGNKIRPDDLEKVKSAFSIGERLPPIEVDVAPNGELWVHDGNHRLLAAAEAGDRPVAVNFRASQAPKIRGEAYDPNVTIAGRLREAIGRSAAPAGGDLEALLRGTQEKIGAGAELKDIGAPARAEYLAAKQAKTAAAAEHFRGKAVAKNYAGSAMAAEEAAARSESLAQRAGVLGRGQRYRVVGEHPLATKELELAHDAALERAATAADPAERAAAAGEARAIEQQLTAVGSRPGAVEDIAALAPAITRVEKAAAALTEALGDSAPAAAKDHAGAFRAAEDAASRKTLARMARAADDGAGDAARSAAASSLPGESISAAPTPTRAQRLAAAGKSKLEADAAFARARAAETEASLGARAAQKARDEAAAKLPPRPGKDAARASSLGERVLKGAKTAGIVAGIAGELGIPGVPTPHDLPVIGPLLGAYLKYRALRAAAGRFVGRLPATAEAKAAALAARTKDTIARAVDRSLGLVANNTATVRSALIAGAVQVNAALSRRAIDDGQPDAGKDASPPELAAVRMREVAAAATNPQLVIDKVRSETRGINDPDLITALEDHLVAMFQHLNNAAPKGPPPNPYAMKPWAPSPAEALQFGRRLAVANDPSVAFQMLHAGNLTPDAADTLRAVYPKLFALAQQRVIERAADLKNPVPYRQLALNAMLFQVPLHTAARPENAAVLATAHAPLAPTPGPQAGAPPTPSIANGTNLSQLFRPAAERGAATSR